MTDVRIRVEGRAGRITLARPEALNALTYAMCRAIDGTLAAWAVDPSVALVVIDGEGRAFCSGGDIAEMYAAGTRGDFAYGRQFWRDEYRMNRRIHLYPKPVVSLLQGYVMGGGVGVGCHASHRVAGGTAKVAMPECGIGLVPDVGGSLLLARAPGRLGEYLGVTGARMGPGDAIHAGFADLYVPEAGWPDLLAALVAEGDPSVVERAAIPPPPSRLAEGQPEIDRLFRGETLGDIADALDGAEGEVAAEARAALARNAPLSMACALTLVRSVRAEGTIEAALAAEHRFTFRAMAEADFLEGIRARIVDKDNAPRWRHGGARDVPPEAVARLLAPLGPDELRFDDAAGGGRIGRGPSNREKESEA